MKFGRWLLLLALVVSLSVNIILGLWARHYYLALNATRLDPVGLAMYRDAAAPAKQTGHRRMLFFGDSRAYAWPAPAALRNVEVLNRGVGGQTTAQILARYDQDVTPLHPDIIIVQAGINDLKTIGLFPGQRDRIVAECKANLAAMVQRATAQGAVVVVTTIFPTAQPSLIRRPFWSDAIALAVVEVNEYLKTLAGAEVVLFDSAALLAGADGAVEPAYSYDLLHLNDEGYRALNRGLRALELFP